DWEHLQKPGFSPDYTQRRQGMMSTDFERADWLPTAAAQALIRNNQPVLGYIAGKGGAFTSKDHNFYPWEAVEKQLVFLNNSRQAVTCGWRWTLGTQSSQIEKKLSIAPGEQARTPVYGELW